MQHAPHSQRYAARIDELRATLNHEQHRHHLSPVDTALSLARISQALWRLGRRAEAYQEAINTATTLLGMGIVITYAADAFAFTADVLVDHCRAHGRVEVSDLARLRALSGELTRYGKRVSFCAPIAGRIEADVLELRGEPAKALATWRATVREAEARNMPYEAALCHRSLALHLPRKDPLRDTHVAAAHAGFVEMRCDFDLAELDH